MDKPKMHMKIISIAGFLLGFLAVGVASNPIDHRKSEDLNGTLNSFFQSDSYDFIDEDGLLTTIITATSNITLVRDSAPSSTKPVISSPPEIVLRAFIPTISENQKTKTQDQSASSKQNDTWKKLNDTFQNTNIESKTTSEDISQHTTTYSSKSTVSSNSSKDSNLLHDESDIVPFSVGTTFEIIDENATSLIEHEYYPDPSTDISMDHLFEWDEKNDQLDTDYNLINSSTETPFEELFSHVNFKNINNITVKDFDSPEESDIYSINESSINLTTKRQNKPGFIDNHQQDPNILHSSTILAPLSLNDSSKFSDLIMLHNLSSHDITASTSKNEEINKQDFEVESEVNTERISTIHKNHEIFYQNVSESVNADSILSENRSIILKNDKQYTLFLPKFCSNYSTIECFWHILSTSSNSSETANLTCKNIKDVKTKLKSVELLDEIEQFLKAEVKSDMVYIKFLPNLTIDCKIISQTSYSGFHVPNFVVTIFTNIVGLILLTVIIVATYKICRRRSTSLNLQKLPHLNLRDDYRLTPIPRPSISYPDSNRAFRHIYPQDNYNCPVQDINTLNRPIFSGTLAKTYKEVEREIGSRQEMHTFTVSSSSKSEFKPSTSQNYASSYSWDHIQAKKHSRKYGVDNSGY